MSDPFYPRATSAVGARRKELAPEIMEAIWVAAEMRAGGAYAHSTLALDVLGGGTHDSGHTHEHHRE